MHVIGTADPATDGLLHSPRSLLPSLPAILSAASLRDGHQPTVVGSLREYGTAC